MNTAFVKEYQPYTKTELFKIFGDAFANTCIKKLKEYGVLKTVKNNSEVQDLSDLTNCEIIVDEDDYTIDRVYVFTFVGIIIVNGVVLKCYPKYIHSCKEPFQELRLILKVLEKYNAKEQVIKMYVNNQSDKEFNRLAAMMYLLTDYYENGIYNNTVDIIEINGNGDIDWNRTINDSYAILKKNRPYYTELHTINHRNNENDYFKRLHECLLTLSSNELSQVSLLELFGLEEVDLTSESIDEFGDVDYILNQIEREINVTFNTRKISVLKTMYMLISNEGTLVDNSSFSLYGTNSFHTVWEDVCSQVLNNDRDVALKKLNLPNTLHNCFADRRNESLLAIIEKPSWYDSDGGKHLADATLIPDLLLVNPQRFAILDAKYYDIILESGQQLAHQPGIGDITKQYLYQLAYQDFINAHQFNSVINCFIMPTENGEQENVGCVRMEMFNKWKLVNINVVKVPATEYFEAYLSNEVFEFNV